jgi:hypothetical protein
MIPQCQGSETHVGFTATIDRSDTIIELLAADARDRVPILRATAVPGTVGMAVDDGQLSNRDRDATWRCPCRWSAAQVCPWRRPDSQGLRAQGRRRDCALG